MVSLFAYYLQITVLIQPLPPVHLQTYQAREMVLGLMLKLHDTNPSFLPDTVLYMVHQVLPDTGRPLFPCIKLIKMFKNQYKIYNKIDI